MYFLLELTQALHPLYGMSWESNCGEIFKYLLEILITTTQMNFCHLMCTFSWIQVFFWCLDILTTALYVYKWKSNNEDISNLSIHICDCCLNIASSHCANFSSDGPAMKTDLLLGTFIRDLARILKLGA